MNSVPTVASASLAVSCDSMVQEICIDAQRHGDPNNEPVANPSDKKGQIIDGICNDDHVTNFCRVSRWKNCPVKPLGRNVLLVHLLTSALYTLFACLLDFPTYFLFSSFIFP